MQPAVTPDDNRGNSGDGSGRSVILNGTLGHGGVAGAGVPGGGVGKRGGSLSRTTARKPFTCADALKQPGKTVTAGISVTGTLLLGLTATRGTWTNMRTSASGKFTTVGFTSGLAAGASVSGQTFASMSAFTGWSDGYTIGASVPVGPFSIGGSYASSWNDSGSGSGGSYDVGSAILPYAGYAASFADTSIS